MGYVNFYMLMTPVALLWVALRLNGAVGNGGCVFESPIDARWCGDELARPCAGRAHALARRCCAVDLTDGVDVPRQFCLVEQGKLLPKSRVAQGCHRGFVKATGVAPSISFEKEGDAMAMGLYRVGKVLRVQRHTRGIARQPQSDVTFSGAPGGALSATAC